MEIKEAVGLRVKELREKTGLSQADFAKATGCISRSYLGMVETGKTSITMEALYRLCAGLGVTMRQFYDSPLFDGRESLAAGIIWKP